MFKPRNRQSNANIPLTSPTNLSRSVMHVLEYNQSPNDFVHDELQGHQQIALQGQTDVPISRAELDLRKAIQALSLLSSGSISSFPTLTALSLPVTATALFWTIHALLQQTYQKPHLENPIYHRDHDARLLFQQLAKLDLVPWYTHSVDKIAPHMLPAGIQFPLGHPIPGELYRQHPFKTKRYYYPVTTYFTMLFEEREQELLALLGNLGARKIAITITRSDMSSSATDETHQRVFEYASQAQTSAQSINLQNYPWLAYEPVWQSVVNERLNRGLLSTQFECDMDVMGLMRTQVQTIAQFVSELDSIMLPANCEDLLLKQVLQTRIVQVDFGEH